MMLLFAASCTKDFESVNTDPNRVNKISPGTLLNPIIYEVSSFNMRKADDFTFGLMQDMLPFPVWQEVYTDMILQKRQATLPGLLIIAG